MNLLIVNNKKKYNSILILTGCILLVSLFVYWKYIFGDRLFIFNINDIGGDTVNMYTPIYKEIVRKMHTGDWSLFSLNLGIGDQLLSYQSVIFDPFAIFIYAAGLAGGDLAIGYSLIFVNILKILCASYTCFWLLSSFSITQYSKIAASFVYALNGFMMLWGQHYFFATAVVLLPLLLGAIERTFSNRRYIAAVAASAFLFSVFSAYLSYMAFVIAAVYFLVRFFQTQPLSWKSFFSCLFSVTAGIIIGLGMACVVFLPTCYLLLTGGSRVSVNQSIFDKIRNAPLFYGSNGLKALFFRFISNNLEGSAINFSGWMNYYESPQLFFSLPFLLLVPQYIINIFKRYSTIRARVASIVSIVLAVLCVLSPVISLVFNMFQDSLLRYTFTLMPIFAIVFAVSLDETFFKKWVSTPAVLLSVQVVMCLIAYAYGKGLANRKLVFVLCVVAVLATLDIICFHFKTSGKFFGRIQRYFPALLLLLIAVNLAAENYITVDHRRTVLKGEYQQTGYDTARLYDTETKDAIDYIQDKEGDNFYRMETLYMSGTVNAGLMRGYRGISGYNSNRSKWYCEYLTEIKGINSAIIFYDILDTVDRDLEGVRYVLSKSPEMDGYTQIKQFGTTYVLQRDVPVNVGYLYNETIPLSSLSTLQPEERRNLLCRFAVIPDGEMLSVPTAKQEDISFAAEDTAINGLHKLAQRSTGVGLSGNSCLLEGRVTAQQDSLLVLSVSYQPGWSAFLDGKQVPIIRSNAAFIGLEVPKGDHVLSLQYHTPLLKAGITISAVFIIIFIIMLIISFRRRQMVAIQND